MQTKNHKALSSLKTDGLSWASCGVMEITPGTLYMSFTTYLHNKHFVAIT